MTAPVMVCYPLRKPVMDTPPEVYEVQTQGLFSITSSMNSIERGLLYEKVHYLLPENHGPQFRTLKKMQVSDYENIYVQCVSDKIYS
jgi:hypothetical protein